MRLTIHKFSAIHQIQFTNPYATDSDCQYVHSVIELFDCLTFVCALWWFTFFKVITFWQSAFRFGWKIKFSNLNVSFRVKCELWAKCTRRNSRSVYHVNFLHLFTWLEFQTLKVCLQEQNSKLELPNHLISN